jgi:hypothetical protein
VRAPTSRPQGRKKKGVNLQTYKFHSLGDYAQFIRLFGGTDSFSTQTVSQLYLLLLETYEFRGILTRVHRTPAERQDFTSPVCITSAANSRSLLPTDASCNSASVER